MTRPTELDRLSAGSPSSVSRPGDRGESRNSTRAR